MFYGHVLPNLCFNKYVPSHRYSPPPEGHKNVIIYDENAMQQIINWNEQLEKGVSELQLFLSTSFFFYGVKNWGKCSLTSHIWAHAGRHVWANKSKLISSLESSLWGICWQAELCPIDSICFGNLQSIFEIILTNSHSHVTFTISPDHDENVCGLALIGTLIGFWFCHRYRW